MKLIKHFKWYIIPEIMSNSGNHSFHSLWFIDNQTRGFSKLAPKISATNKMQYNDKKSVEQESFSPANDKHEG